MKRKIALVTGGYSGEAVISYKSAESMYNNIDNDKWECYIIDIHPSGWFHTNSEGKKISVDKNDFSISDGDEKITFDAVLVGLHGTPGEDGKLQGYFDMLNIPYTSCNAATSALTFNKRYTVAVAAFAGMHVSRSLHLFEYNKTTPSEILDQLQLPLFIKPNNGGSSLGISKVNEVAGLQEALDKSFKEDTQVLVEEYIKGREFTIGVFRSGEKIITLPITEIISKNEFFDYEAKYEGASEEITPANVEESIAEQVRKEAVKAYHVFDCNGIVRIDFIYDAEMGQPYLLEINSVPGQSVASIVPQQVVAMGWTLKHFYTALLEECLNKNN